MVEIARQVGKKDKGCLLVVKDADHALRLASKFGTPSVTTDGTVYEAKTGVRVVPYNACRLIIFYHGFLSLTCFNSLFLFFLIILEALIGDRNLGTLLFHNTQVRVKCENFFLK